MYVKSSPGSAGSFSFLNWKASGSSLPVMLTGDGNLDLGFDEVVLSPPINNSSGAKNKTGWPDPNSNEVTGYPLLPNQLTEGDWMYATNSWNSSFEAALDYHIANRTTLNLPIVDRVIGASPNLYAHFLRMGAFLLRSRGSSSNPYLDLVYIGAASKTACLNTNVNQGLKGLGISGQVYVNPRWVENQPPHSRSLITSCWMSLAR